MENSEVTSVTDNTKDVTSGSVFVCIKGKRFDGHAFAEEMLEKGAVAVVTDRDTGLDRQIKVCNTRLALAEISSRFNGRPTEKLGLLAVTGTNGKTTTAHLVKHILTTLGKRCGCIGTAGNDLCGTQCESVHGTATTPTAPVLYQWFSAMVENGADYCVMEASSMALCQYRIANENFLSAGFTNLTHDHLDYHITMENYYEAKSRLFELTDNPVICIDDEYGKRLYERFKDKAISYSVNGRADIYADYINITASKTEFMLISEKDKKSCKVTINMTGIYNVQNALCAIIMTSLAGYDICDCAKTLLTLDGVPGRMNTVYSGDFTVITDYAHTDDALEKMLSAVKKATKGRLICVFGSAGERDTEKRPLMGRVVSRYADVIIISSDNPAHENPDDIIEQIMPGIDKTKYYEKHPDRKEAVERAIELAQKDDVVVLAGKGHETYQIIGDEYVPFSEAQIVKDYINREKE